jgi:hypothetical protein
MKRLLQRVQEPKADKVPARVVCTEMCDTGLTVWDSFYLVPLPASPIADSARRRRRLDERLRLHRGRCGLAGCAVAARLSKNAEIEVLLLETGGTNLVDETHQPPLWPTLWSTEVKGATREYQVPRLQYMGPVRSAAADGSGEVDVEPAARDEA